MPSRVKNRHKPRHHTHAVKPANLAKPGPKPVIPVYVETPSAEAVNSVATDPVKETPPTSKE